MAMYVWDRFTMSLVLMYSRPTCGQRDGAGVRRTLHSRQQGLRGPGCCGHLTHWRRLLVREKTAVTDQQRRRGRPRLQPRVQPRARTRYLVKGRLPKPVFPEQQGPGRGGGQQRGVFVLLRHLLLAPLPGAQVEQQ